MSESILEEAQRLIHGERNKNYGHPRENFKDIALLFSGYLEKEISDIDVANLMILMKIARVKGTGYHRDSFTDMAGYAGCVERIYEEPVEGEPRQWDTLADVPKDVKTVRSARNAFWSWYPDYNERLWGHRDGFKLDHAKISEGPFVEVLGE